MVDAGVAAIIFRTEDVAVTVTTKGLFGRRKEHVENRRALRAYLVLPGSGTSPGDVVDLGGERSKVPYDPSFEPAFATARTVAERSGWRLCERWSPTDRNNFQQGGWTWSVPVRARRLDLFPGADLSGRDLSGADLVGEQLSGVTLAGARLRRADLRFATFAGSDTTRADLTAARLTSADMRDARLAGATLHGVVCDGNTRMDRADMSGAVLTRAELHGVASGIVLADADLSGASVGGSFDHANLARADLRTATVHSASFGGTDLRTTRLPAVEAMTSVTWTPATRWPAERHDEVVARSEKIRGPAQDGRDQGLFILNRKKPG